MEEGNSELVIDILNSLRGIVSREAAKVKGDLVTIILDSVRSMVAPDTLEKSSAEQRMEALRDLVAYLGAGSSKNDLQLSPRSTSVAPSSPMPPSSSLAKAAPQCAPVHAPTALSLPFMAPASQLSASAFAALNSADDALHRLHVALERQVLAHASVQPRLSALEAEARSIRNRDMIRQIGELKAAAAASHALSLASMAAARTGEERQRAVTSELMRDVSKWKWEVESIRESVAAANAHEKREVSRLEGDIRSLRASFSACEADKGTLADSIRSHKRDFEAVVAIAREAELREKTALLRVSDLESERTGCVLRVSELESERALLEGQLARASEPSMPLVTHTELMGVAAAQLAQALERLAAAEARSVQLQSEVAAANEQAATHASTLEKLLADADLPAVKDQGELLPSERHAEAVTVEQEKESRSFVTVPDFLAKCRLLGMKTAQLIIGIDCTKSNLWTGQNSFGGRPLHELSTTSGMLNPYQIVIGIIGRALKDFDDDGLIPCFGFGCKRTTDMSVFSFKSDNAPCSGIDDVLDTYAKVIPGVNLAGPTSFAPLIKKAVDIVKKENGKQLTVLLIIADGQVTAVKETAAAIVEASKFSIAIVCIGVGDGPWEDMKKFDDGLPTRKVDNFQFVDLNTVTTEAVTEGRSLDDYFTLSALAELPNLLQAMKKARIL